MSVLSPTTSLIPVPSQGDPVAPANDTQPSVSEQLAQARALLRHHGRQYHLACEQLRNQDTWSEPGYARWQRRLKQDHGYQVGQLRRYIEWLEAGCPEPVEPMFVPADE